MAAIRAFLFGPAARLVTARRWTKFMREVVTFGLSRTIPAAAGDGAQPRQPLARWAQRRAMSRVPDDEAVAALWRRRASAPIRYRRTYADNLASTSGPMLVNALPGCPRYENGPRSRPDECASRVRDETMDDRKDFSLAADLSIDRRRPAGIKPSYGRSACSPTQQPVPEHAPEQGRYPKRKAIPDCDERHGIILAM